MCGELDLALSHDCSFSRYLLYIFICLENSSDVVSLVSCVLLCICFLKVFKIRFVRSVLTSSVGVARVNVLEWVRRGHCIPGS